MSYNYKILKIEDVLTVDQCEYINELIREYYKLNIIGLFNDAIFESIKSKLILQSDYMRKSMNRRDSETIKARLEFGCMIKRRSYILSIDESHIIRQVLDNELHKEENIEVSKEGIRMYKTPIACKINSIMPKIFKAEEKRK